MRRGCWLVLLGLAFSRPAGAEALPAWVNELAAPGPAAPGTAAEVLLREQRVSVPAKGQITKSERGAVLIREAAGQQYAHCVVYYERGTSDVRQLRAWLVVPGRPTREFERSDATDFSVLGSGVLVSDQRALRLAADDAPAGSTFAYEWTRREAPLVAQWSWLFASPIPVSCSRFELELPAGGEAEAVGAPASVQTTHVDNRWSWEMRALAAMREPPLSPASPGADQLLRVSVHAHSSNAPAGAEFASWQDVGRWSQRLSDPQAAADASIVAKARELTAGLQGPLAQARAIGAFVQTTNYVALNLGMGLGFGYRPRPASEVLASGYGDCKDKANLVKALLQAAGQQAWLVAVYAGDRYHVQKEWPTVCQFNHCIVALRAPQGVMLPAADPGSPLGPIVYFDPTDPCTRFGELPATLQGSFGLLQTAEAPDLVRLPFSGAGAFGTRRRIRAALADDGSLEGEWVETDTGPQAAATRCLRRQGERLLRADDEAMLMSATQRADIADWSAADVPDSSRFERRMRFNVPSFARHSGASLMSFAASVLPSEALPALADTGRTEPLDLEHTSFDASVTLRLPSGWKPDEVPKDRRIERDFGALEASWKVEAGVVAYRCRWRTEPLRVPAARYEEVRAFFNAVRAAEGAPIVLMRQ